MKRPDIGIPAAVVAFSRSVRPSSRFNPRAATICSRRFPWERLKAAENTSTTSLSMPRRVYLSQVEVLDADSGSVVGKISGLKRDHGVALVSELNRGFITDGDAGHAVRLKKLVLRPPLAEPLGSRDE